MREKVALLRQCTGKNIRKYRESQDIASVAQLVRALFHVRKATLVRAQPGANIFSLSMLSFLMLSLLLPNNIHYYFQTYLSFEI